MPDPRDGQSGGSPETADLTRGVKLGHGPSGHGSPDNPRDTAALARSDERRAQDNVGTDSSRSQGKGRGTRDDGSSGDASRTGSVDPTPSVRPLQRVGAGIWKSRDGRWTFMRHESDPYPKRWFIYEDDNDYSANEGSGITTLRAAVEFVRAA